MGGKDFGILRMGFEQPANIKNEVMKRQHNEERNASSFIYFTPVKQLQVLKGTALRHLRQARQAPVKHLSGFTEQG
jgi:uncharacterized protein YgiM (DUF1202 family)